MPSTPSEALLDVNQSRNFLIAFSIAPSRVQLRQ